MISKLARTKLNTQNKLFHCLFFSTPSDKHLRGILGSRRFCEFFFALFAIRSVLFVYFFVIVWIVASIAIYL